MVEMGRRVEEEEEEEEDERKVLGMYVKTEVRG